MSQSRDEPLEFPGARVKWHSYVLYCSWRRTFPENLHECLAALARLAGGEFDAEEAGDDLIVEAYRSS